MYGNQDKSGQMSADYTVRSAYCAPLAKEHLTGFELCSRLVRLSLYF